MDKGIEQHRQIRVALKASVAVEAVLDAYPRAPALPAEAVSDLSNAIAAFLTCGNALSSHYASLGQKLFNVTIKFHYLAHAAAQAHHLNPRLGWCYAGEDYMSKVKRTAASTMRGTAPHLVSAKMLRKYSLGMHLRFSGGAMAAP